eukprot:6193362-Pleurochrysis_carterae.AAC.4
MAPHEQVPVASAQTQTARSRSWSILPTGPPGDIMAPWSPAHSEASFMQSMGNLMPSQRRKLEYHQALPPFLPHMQHLRQAMLSKPLLPSPARSARAAAARCAHCCAATGRPAWPSQHPSKCTTRVVWAWASGSSWRTTSPERQSER